MQTPVILIPGVMGSRLHLTEELRWDPDSDLNMWAWRRADLPTKRRHLSVTETPATVFDDLGHQAALEASTDEESLIRSRGWAGLAWGFYGPGLRELQRRLNPDGTGVGSFEPFPVYAFGYDFRTSNLASAHQLVEFVDITRAATSAAKVILVTHSMGGLVARAACTWDPTFIDKVDRVIHVGQPADGCPTFYRRFLTGVVPKYDDHAPLTEIETWLQEHVLAHIIGTTPQEFATLMSVLPGPMQLLPSTRFVSQLSAPWLADESGNDLGGLRVYETYRRTDEFGIMESVADTDVQSALERQLRDAEQFHAKIGGFCHPSTFCIYGTGIATDRTTRPGRRAQLAPRSLTGDGTVDESCANGVTFDDRNSIKRTKSISGVDHSKMLLDHAVITEIHSAVTTFAE